MKTPKKLLVIACVVGAAILLCILGLILLSRPKAPSVPITGSPAKDTVPPTVRLVITTASLEQAKNSKLLTVSAIAKDDRKVTQVSYLLDGKLAGASTKDPFTVSISIAQLSTGDHNLQALAYDVAGNLGKSEAFGFKIDPNKAITPSNNQSQSMVQNPSTGGTNAPSGDPDPGGDETPPESPPAASCALPAYPTAACTGVPGNTTLSTVNGDMTINAANTVIEGKNIVGCVTINAPGVIIRKSKIACSGDAIHNNSTNLLIEDVDISCNDMLGGTGVTVQDYTARRINVHDCDNVMWAQQNVLIEDSYIHDPITYDPVTDPHTDGIQVPSGASNITIRHNTIYGNYEGPSSFGNSAITTGADNVSDLLIIDNLLAGGGFTLYCPQNGSGNNFRVINNHFSTIFVSTVGGFGPWIYCENETQVTGNIYHETGLPVPF